MFLTRVCKELAGSKATLWLRSVSDTHPVFGSTAQAHGWACAELHGFWIGSAWCCKLPGFIALQGSHFGCGKLFVVAARFE